MNDRLTSSSSLDEADEALLEQGIRSLRETLPDEARMQNLEQRLAPVFEGHSAPPRWRIWAAVAGSAVVIMGLSFGGGLRMTPRVTPADPATVAAKMPSTSVTSPAAVSAIPMLSVESLPAAPATEATSMKARSAPLAPARASGPEGISDEGDELALLEEARIALAGDPARALSLADTHAKRFRKPSFAQERERLAVDALVRLGRRDDAVVRAKHFEATYPDSAHLARVRALITP